MTNNTTEIWENLKEGGYQIILEYIGWLIFITFIFIKRATELSGFLTKRCLKSLKYVFQMILTTLNYLDNCCLLIVDDIDENIPLVIFKENAKSEKRYKNKTDPKERRKRKGTETYRK